MNAHELKNGRSAGHEVAAANTDLRVAPGGPGDATDFAQVMEGLALSPVMARQPSLTMQWMRAPVAAYGRVMESLERPAPAGMPVLQAMEFYAQKQIDLNDARTLQNVVATVAKLAKKNVETVLNNK